MRVRRTLAALLAAPCLLTACGGGGSSVADPPVTGSPTSSSPTTKPPARESPQHFIRRWAAADTRMQNTGDPSAFLAMGYKCNGCEAVARTVHKIYSHGGNVSTEGWKLLSATQSNRSGRKRTFDLRVDSAPTTYIRAHGGSTQRLAGGREHFQIVIEPRSGAWVVRSFVQVAP